MSTKAGRQTCYITELHQLTGLDRSTLAKRIRHLKPVNSNVGAAGRVTYYLDEVVGALIHSFKQQTEDGPKARKEFADAEKAELIVAKLKGEVAPVDAMRSAAADLVKSLYQRCVHLGPRLLANEVTGNKDRGEVEIQIRAHMARIFEELRSLPNTFLDIEIIDDPVNTISSDEDPDDLS